MSRIPVPLNRPTGTRGPASGVRDVSSSDYDVDPRVTEKGGHEQRAGDDVPSPPLWRRTSLWVVTPVPVPGTIPVSTPPGPDDSDSGFGGRIRGSLRTHATVPPPVEPLDVHPFERPQGYGRPQTCVGDVHGLPTDSCLSVHGRTSLKGGRRRGATKTNHEGL